MANIQIFNNPQFGEVRTVIADDGEPRFCLADLCKALELKPKFVKRRLTDEVVSNNPIIDNLGREQQALFVNEDGLYDTILSSRKPIAKVFRKWVTSEVIPSIRKTGGYMVERPDDTPEDIMARALVVAQETLKRREARLAQLEEENSQQCARIEAQQGQIAQQGEQIRQAAPKVEYYDNTLQSVNTMTTTQVANSLGLDAHKLNVLLQEAGIIYRQSGQWLLYSPYNKWGLHATRTQTYTRSDGRVGTSTYTVWNERGRRFIIALANNNWNPKAALLDIRNERKEETASFKCK